MFEVLREPTLTLHPSSILTGLAENHCTDAPIFVEANADLFSFILDYHRHRKIFIPANVSREAVQREARVLGLSISSDEIIQEENTLAMCGHKKVSVSCEVAKSVMQSKTALLSDLVIMKAVQKVGDASPFVVQMREACGEDAIRNFLSNVDFDRVMARVDEWAVRHGFSKPKWSRNPGSSSIWDQTVLFACNVGSSS